MRRLTAVLTVLLTASVPAFGSGYPWAYWPLAAASATAGVWAIVITRAWRERSPRLAMMCLGVVAVAIGLQLVPIPMSAFVHVAPAADEFLSHYDLRYLVEPPAWHPLSIASSSTLIVLSLFIAFGLLFVGLMEAFAHARLERLVIRVMWLGVVVAVFGVIQRAINVKSPIDEWQLVYGFWTPQQPGNVSGPFITRHHYPGWMVMALSLVMGYTFAIVEITGPSVRNDWRRWVHWTMTPGASRFMSMAVAVLGMGAALAATGSRSGVI